MYKDEGAYGFGKYLPSFWHDMVSEKTYADTWGEFGLHNNEMNIWNETAYKDDAPRDYWFDAGSPNGDVTQWEPDTLLQLDQQVQLK